MPGVTPPNIADCNRLLQHSVSRFDLIELAERGGKPTVRVGEIRIGPDRPLRDLDRSRVISGKIKRCRQLAQSDGGVWIARVEPDASLNRLDTFLGTPRENQGHAQHLVGKSQVRCDSPCSLRFLQSALIVATLPEGSTE
jgi:hypothetical protein